MSISKNHVPITSLCDWETYAGPKSPNQWVDGRSAKEAARAWLGSDETDLPSEVQAILAEHQDFGPVSSWSAEPEAKLHFDEFPGEPRNSDLVVHAVDAQGQYLIAVEAKADEPFGDTVADTLASAMERALDSERSKGIERAQQLSQKLFGPRRKGEPHLKAIRYQLLTACAGALCEAERRGYSRALVLIHEFITSKTSDDKHRQNAIDLNMFIKRLSHGAVEKVADSVITGPFTFSGGMTGAAKVQLYVGKISRNLRN